MFARARGAMSFGVGDGQRERRIGGHVLGRDGFQTQVRDESDQVAAARRMARNASGWRVNQ